MIRNLWVGLNLIVATVPLSLVIIAASYLGGKPHLYDYIPRWWSRWLLWASGVRLDVSGIEHVELDRPQIIVANHASWYDVLALATCTPKRYRFVAKKELARVPLFGHAWQAAGHISVDRSDRQHAVTSLDRAGRVIREDNSAIIIFPEGTRSATGELQPFKKGAFVLALHNATDIVPAVVIGTRGILAKDSWRVRPGRIIVRFGTPVRTAVEYGVEDRDELMTRVRSQMESLLALPAST